MPDRAYPAIKSVLFKKLIPGNIFRIRYKFGPDSIIANSEDEKKKDAAAANDHVDAAFCLQLEASFLQWSLFTYN